MARSWKEGRRIEKLQEVKEEARKSERKRTGSTALALVQKQISEKMASRKALSIPRRGVKQVSFQIVCKYYTGQHIQSLDWTGLDLFL